MIMFFVLIIILMGYGVSTSNELRQQTNLSKNKRIFTAIILTSFGLVVYLIGSQAASFVLELLVLQLLTDSNIILLLFLSIGIPILAGLAALRVYFLLSRKLIRRLNQRNTQSQVSTEEEKEETQTLASQQSPETGHGLIRSCPFCYSISIKESNDQVRPEWTCRACGRIFAVSVDQSPFEESDREETIIPRPTGELCGCPLCASDRILPVGGNLTTRYWDSTNWRCTNCRSSFRVQLRINQEADQHLPPAPNVANNTQPKAENPALKTTPMTFSRMWFSFQGTCNRRDYWLTGTIPLLVAGATGPALWYALVLSGIIDRETYFSGMRVVIGTGIILLLWPYLAIHRKRMREIGFPGIWMLWVIMPWTAPLATPILGLLPGKKGTTHQNPGSKAGTGMIPAIAIGLLPVVAAFIIVNLDGPANEGPGAQNNAASPSEEIVNADVEAAVEAAVQATLEARPPTPVPTPGAVPVLMPNILPTPTPRAVPTPVPIAFSTPVPIAFPTVLPTLVPIASPTLVPNVPPTQTPDEFVKYGGQELFFGETALLIDAAAPLFEDAKYEEALEKYIKAQSVHGEPSRILQNRIGLTYTAMGQPEEAIKHFSIAIQTEDTRQDRINRAEAYASLHHYTEAIRDINVALLMDPEEDEPLEVKIGIHALATNCYIGLENYSRAEDYRQAGLKLAEENDYSDENTATLVELEEIIEWLIEGEIYPEDLMKGQALADYTAGLELFNAGRYEEALDKLKSVQPQLTRPSSRLEDFIGAVYLELNQNDLAIFQFNRAIEIRDDSYNRESRSYAHFMQGNCPAAVNDAVALLTMKPYVEPGYHSLAEAHFTIGTCKYEEASYEEALEHLNKGLEVALVYGYEPEVTDTYIEIRELANELINQTPTPEPTPAPATPTPVPTPPRRAVEPTIVATPTPSGNSRNARSLTAIANFQNARWLEHTHPDVARKAARLRWVADGLTALEQETLESIIHLFIRTKNKAIFDMPFLQNKSPGDLQALESLRIIASKDTGQFNRIFNHPTFAGGGITDDWVPIVSALWAAQRSNPSLIPALLDPSKVTLETRTYNLSTAAKCPCTSSDWDPALDQKP